MNSKISVFTNFLCARCYVSINNVTTEIDIEMKFQVIWLQDPPFGIPNSATGSHQL